MADDNDILFRMFKHYMDQGLHHQEQRSSTANIILVLAGVTVGLITYDQKLGGTDIIAAFFLIALGLFGTLWSAKYHERYAYYLERARGYRNKLDTLLPQINMKAINETADKTVEGKYKILHRIRVWYLWAFLNLLIVILGVIIVMFYYTQPTP